MSTDNTEEKKPTPQQLIDKERLLKANLYRIGGKDTQNTALLIQLDKAINGCDCRVRMIQIENGLEVTNG
jgi:hypothetical protein